jgi:hypothetical protein
MNDQFEPKKPRYYHKNASGHRWTEQTWDAYIAQVEHYLALPEPGPKYEIVDDGPEDTRGPDDLLAAMTLAMRNGSAMDELEELMEIQMDKTQYLHVSRSRDLVFLRGLEKWKNLEGHY